MGRRRGTAYGDEEVKADGGVGGPTKAIEERGQGKGERHELHAPCPYHLSLHPSRSKPPTSAVPDEDETRNKKSTRVVLRSCSSIHFGDISVGSRKKKKKK